MLERHLDVILGEEEKKHPLRFPPSDKYRFAEPNTDENIVYEDREKSNGIPLIKVHHLLVSGDGVWGGGRSIKLNTTFHR